MSSDYLLRMNRRDERRDLTGRCTITRGTHPNVSTVSSGVPCLVLPSTSLTREVDVAAGGQVTLNMYEVHLPVDTDVARDDVLTVTTSRDADLVGRWLRVFEVVVGEWTSSRTVICEEPRSGG